MSSKLNLTKRLVDSNHGLHLYIEFAGVFCCCCLLGQVGGVFTWQRVEIIYEVGVFAVGIGGDEVELVQELRLRWVAGIHDAQRVHLHVNGVRFPHGDVQLDGVTLVRLPVCDDHCHLPHAGSSAVESPYGHADSAARVGALAHVGHVTDRLLDVLLIGVGCQFKLSFDLRLINM